jgi:hypothetical protein
MADNYRVEVSYWYRDRSGDWDISDYWLNFDTLAEAYHHAHFPRGSKNNLIDVKIFDMTDGYKVSDSTLIYSKDYAKERRAANN